MFKDNSFILLVTLAFIFLICGKDKYATPLNFDTFFEVDNSNSFLNGKM
ncbi:MAG: hypothetical protein RR136_04855 [Clostridia bacterium]